MGVCAPSGAFDHVYTLLSYGGAVAHAEASYMMPGAGRFAWDSARTAVMPAWSTPSTSQATFASETPPPASRVCIVPVSQPVMDIDVPAADPYERQLRYFCDTVGRGEGGLTRAVPPSIVSATEV